MPISSFPISVRSSVNLSDINIDSDLNLGSNNLILSGNISNYSKDFITIIHGITPLNFSNLSGGNEVNILDDTTEYATPTYGTWYTKITLTLTEALSELITPERKFRLTWQTEIKNSQTYQTNVAMGISTFTSYSQTGNTYGVKGGIASQLTYNPYSYNDSLIIQVKSSSGIGYTKNNKVWLIGWVEHYPSVMTNDDIESYGYSGISNIILFNGDSIKINDDLIFNGITNPTTPNIDSLNRSYYKPSQYSDIEQIEILAGHPQITFKI